MKTYRAMTLVTALILLILTGCTLPHDKLMQDGTYEVTFDKPDSTGWRAFLRLKITGNRITEVEYDYWGTAEKMNILKSSDTSYAEAMASVTGTKPELYITQLEQNLLLTQNPDKIETVSGATTSSRDFKHFAKIAVDAARNDTTHMIIVPQND